MERDLFFLAEDVAAGVPSRHESMNRPGPEEEEEERAFYTYQNPDNCPPPTHSPKALWGGHLYRSSSSCLL